MTTTADRPSVEAVVGPLPCPFCGYDEGPDVVNAYIASQQITMKKCVCRCCKACTGLSTSHDGALKKWNTRANARNQGLAPQGETNDK